MQKVPKTQENLAFLEELPVDPPCFPSDRKVDAAALHARLATLLEGFRASSETDPFGNPILRTALELTRLVDKGELSSAGLEQVVQYMTARAFERRAGRVCRFLGETDVEQNEIALRTLIRDLAMPAGADKPVAIDVFRQAVETFAYGIVFTAHPTFSCPRDVARALAWLAAGRDAKGEVLDEAARAALLGRVEKARHRPPTVLSLDIEFAWAMEAIGHAQNAVERLHAAVFDVAREVYPEEWTTLSPRMVSVASWVGYDHDGRADIGWADTLRMRLRVKLAQLIRTRDLCEDVCSDATQSNAIPTLELIESILTLAIKQVELQIDASLAIDANSTERALSFAQKLVDGREHALTDTSRLDRLFQRAIEQAENDDLKRSICVVRAGLLAHGLGLAHTHFRLNATQLHNSIRHQIGLETSPADPSHRRSYIARMNDALATVDPVQINIGSLMAERASARRIFMAIAQLVKHVDSETPIRFLIAETETAFTLLVALYYARLFGIDHMIEISPLFETADALEHGDSIIEEAVLSPHFRAYLIQQGRLCLQFGYSDSGRYVGQMASSFWIERLRLKIVAVLAKHGLEKIQVVMFNTHGESIGRGGHPVSLADRFRYLAPPVSRQAFRAAGLGLKEEVSFQGGDGYVYFQAEELAFAAVCRAAEAGYGSQSDELDDPIYGETDFSTEFFAVVQQEFSGIVEEPGYAALLGTFGKNLVDRAGSRPVKRQQDFRVGGADKFHPKQIRAITNNSVLQQLGLLANTVTGVGRAMAKDPERARNMRAQSPRFRRALDMVEAALAFSDLDVLRAYVDTFDPGMWLNRSGRTRVLGRREELRMIVRQLERNNFHPELSHTFRHLQSDCLTLRAELADAHQEGGPSKAASFEQAHDELALLHAVRISLMHRLYLLTAHVPDFTPHEDVARDDLFQRVLRLEVDEVVAMLREIFPRRDTLAVLNLNFAEPATYQSEAGQTYESENEDIFDPLAAHFELLRRITAAITHHIGAVG